ncbi:2'-5' RNA ligase family protein [Kineococcus terrestris]|uniref:2'-5' RNA ligase family protein n=1 Tax=Kineococcus terrestris TaxID=2044856 RepID=UPI0034DB04B5
MAEAGDAPLVLTAALADDDAERLDVLRRERFPAHRNKLAAHVTLFHALPGERLGDVLDDLRAVCRRPGLDVPVTGVRSLGRGAALVLEPGELARVRAELARRWQPWLTRQDAQGFRPHVTVQNFVDPAVARATVADLSASFAPFAVRVVGVDVHRYLGGPWEHLHREEFDAGS